MRPAHGRRGALSGIGTFEFLVDDERPGRFYFMEANPRIQVEHTVTEEVTGVDLLHAQLRLAAGMELAALGLERPPAIGGCAVQLLDQPETLAADGSARPAVGTIGAYEPPSGPGLRVDGYGYAGYRVSPSYDSLLAKLVVRGADYPAALRRAYRALCEFRLEGVASNLDLLRNLLLHPAVQANRVDTRFVESHLETLLAPIPASHPRLRAECLLAEDAAPARVEAPLGSLPLSAPSSGVLVALEVADGERVRAGQRVAILEAMKMEFEVKAPGGGIVRRLAASLGEPLEEGATLLFLEPTEDDDEQAPTEQALDLAHIRADLAEVLERQAALGDERRPQALARRRKTGQRTARENVLDLLDEGSFSEYGGFALAAQRRRRSAEELLELSPADGLVAGTGTVGAASFGVQAARCLVLAYDYTVFAGTQGVMNHKKTDRLLGLAEQWRLPLVLFAEGGGGRPGDTDFVGVAGLDCHTFVGMARLSGLVPLVGVVSGRCFAGNAALLGCCDVIIATRDATIGMAGPAMIEGGGLGRFAAEEVGPTGVQGPNGVIDVLVADEAEAVAVARRYLGYFQGPLPDWSCADQRELRHLVPENRLRAYDIRQAIEVLADRGSVLELRRQFAPGLVTALLRIEGRAFGLIANNPGHLGGAIDAAAGDKAARFMQLCDAFDIPDRLALRHPWLHGRPGGGKTGHGAPRLADVRQRRQPDGAVLHRGPAQGLRTGSPGHGGGQLPFAAVHRRLAQRRVRRHGPGRRGAAGLRQGAGGRGRLPAARGAVPWHGGQGLPQRQGAEHGQLPGDRRGDRPGGDPRLAPARPGRRRRTGAEGGAQAAVRGYLVDGRPAVPWRLRTTAAPPEPARRPPPCRSPTRRRRCARLRIRRRRSRRSVPAGR